ncbi:MAG: hypothetical protein RLZZ553_1068 [Verrucomicrobiota bacterium]
MSMNEDSIGAGELRQIMAGGCCLVDVREAVEYAEERIAGAKSIPLGQLAQRRAELDPDKPLVVMCRSGKRGEQAMNQLRAMGITTVRNLEGGILAWKAAGMPIEQTRKNVMPLMQQVQLTIGLGVLTGAILALTVDPRWAFLCAFFGAGLTMAGSTGWCGLAILMSKMPWNRISGETACGNKSCSLS